MSFATILTQGNLDAFPARRAFCKLLEPCPDAALEALAARSAAETIRQFGRTMRLFAPLYLSNECINNCKYCGFSRDNPILRVTLPVEQVVAEARHLAAAGFRNILLVAGEHPKFVSNGYLAECIRTVRTEAGLPGVSLEVGPMETAEYRAMVAAGAEGLVVYQETYDRATYEEMHTSGPKRDFQWRLDCPERAYAAGFRRLGIGALFGLCEDWRAEALALAAHIDYLLKHCWRAQITVSLPRMRPAAGGFAPRSLLSDRELVQLLCALRVTFPQVGLVLSTREAADFRDILIPLGVTMMSAGSHTEPGGYTGVGRDDLHRTIRGRRVKAEELAADAFAEGQFDIADTRSPGEVAAMLRDRHGLEPVWKDWDQALSGTAAN